MGNNVKQFQEAMYDQAVFLQWARDLRWAPGGSNYGKLTWKEGKTSVQERIDEFVNLCLSPTAPRKEF